MNPALRMLLALALGLGGGILAGGHAPITGYLLPIARPIGSLWLDALTMTIVPLVFGLIVNGIASATREAAASHIALQSIVGFATLLTVACALGALVATGILHAWPLSEQAIALRSAPLMAAAGPGGTHWYEGIIPANPIKAAAETAMVPLLIFALLFGFALMRIDTRLGDAVLALTEALVQTMLVIVHWVLRLAPLGITALAFVAGVNMGAAAAGALGQYIVVASAACLAATAMAYLAAIFVGRLSPMRFARAVAPAQAVALGTQSSLATLPVMIDSAPAVGADPRVAGIVLPLAVTLFRAASAAANVAVAIYLAHLHGVHLSIPMLILAVLVAVPVSLAAVGVAAQVSFIATIAPICVALGVPFEVLPLLMAVETIPDLFRTLGNVTADLAVTAIVSTRQPQAIDG
ncbi:dicarboxylate/amino acid:cation symporter [Rhizorhabdus dicambivorans]|uniref:Dicarboxylate/amino acid:cation symporter n=1 Tax=Rhizorhabdus dicambivorans TaxID=1850238 RepID=A0A2A4FUH4_9SPHN|nr:cation:dicarboxylase symporter family transporter [Rhizorhabdus dicambivorans]ATE66141.1 dicarboxylate/amino acid:cation symporter [Rhizorhabdus dicambivorans]PCE42068.1 dicarboxylate/amino acid:cation symporter [Rhizorhabdus dicambivorans]